MAAQKPLHERIMGPAWAELSECDRMERELEVVYQRGHVEIDTYLSLSEALDNRRARAQAKLDKLTPGAASAREASRVVVVKQRKPLQVSPTLVGIIFVFVIFLLWKG